MSRLKRLVSEIHQRSLWQALVVYLGASYAVLEAAALFRDEFGLPGWLLPVALVLLLIGLPVVVVTSLAKEEVYGDEVPAADAETAAIEDRRLRLLTWRTAGLSFLGAMALWGVIAAGLLLSGTYEHVEVDERQSIAVLPFDNLSPEPDDAYFSDGIHDEIITQLHKITSFDVISRTSVLAYRDIERNLREIGRELGVTTIMEGSVRRAGDRVRITTQLIDAESDRHLWAETYERSLADIFAIQAEIAQTIAESLRVQLSPEEEGLIAAVPTQNLEAYDLYLRHVAPGGGSWRTSETLPAAEADFKRATELDPGFVLAWFGLARARVYLYMPWGRAEKCDEAWAAIERLDSLAPDAFETHLAKGLYYRNAERDFAKAEEHYNIALRLRPSSSPDVYSDLAGNAAFQGRWEETVRYRERAMQLDPLSARRASALASAYELTGDFERAERYHNRALTLGGSTEGAAVFYMSHGDTVRARKLLEEVSDTTSDIWRWRSAHLALLRRDYTRALALFYSVRHFPFIYYNYAAVIYRRTGQPELARIYADSLRQQADPSREAELGFKSPGNCGSAVRRWWAARAYAMLGEAAPARASIAQALEDCPMSVDALNGSLFYGRAAGVYVMLGDHESAIQYMDSSLSVRPGSPTTQRLRISPTWDPLRDDPRFQALLKKYEQQ